MRPGSAWVRAVLALLCLGGVISVAWAQGQYPSRPIRMLVGFSPGGSTDILARIVGQKLGERFQQQVVIENRPGEVFKMLTRVRFVHVPYKGAGQVLVDLLGGHVHLAFPTVPAAMPHLKSARLRALAVTAAKRSSALPDLPTMSEAGVTGYEVIGWYGVLAPARVPKEVVSLLGDEISKILRAQEVRDRLLREGAEPVGNGPDEFGSFLASDVDKWAKVVRALNLKVD